MVDKVFAISLVLIATLIGAFGALFLKLGSKKLSLKFKNVFTNYKFLFGIFLYGISALFFIGALRYGQLTLVYPFVSIGYIWIILLSMYFLKEKMNFYKWLGITLIILGVSLIGLSG
ncbi:MAG: EamA family transporter [Candidatus Woesearchaeota archaeon]|nr:EamA family transporter [Candidatus Woesearchaeota archaeon]